MYPRAKLEEENSPAAIGKLIEHVIEDIEEMLPIEEMVEVVRSKGVTGSNAAH